MLGIAILSSYFVVPVFAEAMEISIAGDNTLVIEGNEFSYERSIEIIDGQIGSNDNIQGDK